MGNDHVALLESSSFKTNEYKVKFVPSDTIDRFYTLNCLKAIVNNLVRV